VFGTQGKKWKMEREAYFSLFPLFGTYRGKEENKKNIYGQCLVQSSPSFFPWLPNTASKPNESR